MRFPGVLILFMCAGGAWAQASDPEVIRAKAGIDKLRALVEAGAAPRRQLQQAEEAIADAEDAAYLRKTMYGSDLSEEDATGMVEAARRRFDRRQKGVDEARKLVDAGVASQVSLGNFLEELELARKECDLAEARAGLVREVAAMARTEQTYSAHLDQSPGQARGIAERYDGDGIFNPGTFSRVERAYEARFGKPLPVSAQGETAVHRALGFDHRGRVDVAIHPDQPEGVWLRRFLIEHRIPFFAFRQAVAGKATGAHIHMGPMSTRLSAGG
jgi:hypothetical protein